MRSRVSLNSVNRLTELVTPVMLRIEADAVVCMLTEEAKCGMIAVAWTMDYDCCGDADAAAEAPPRLTSSPGLI